MRSQISQRQASILNMLLAGIYQAVMIIFGFFVPQLLLTTYGADLHGYTSTVSNIMRYIALINAGLSSASVQALYEPLSRKDARRINETLNAIGHFYKISGFLYALAVLAVAAVLPIFLSEQLPTATIVLLMLVMGAESTAECFLYCKLRTLLQADQRLFVVLLTDMAAYLVRAAGQLILIRLGAGIVWVMAAPAVMVILRMLLLSAYCRKNYPELDRTVEGDKSVLSKRWSAMVHQISGLVVYNTDVMLLTLFGTLVQVSIYSVYNLVFSQLRGMLTSVFSNGTVANFGQLMFEEKRESLLKDFDLYEYVCCGAVTFICGVSASMILPFVGLYTRKFPDIPYVDVKLAALFVLIAFFNAMRTPSLTMINAAGHFKETQWRAILEACINLGVSLLLLRPLGMYGLLIGTVCSFAYRTSDIIYYAHKHILHIPCGKTVRRFFRSGCVILASVWLYRWAVGAYRAGTWGEWLLYALIASLLTGMLTAAAFFLTERGQFMECLHILFRRRVND